VSVAGVTNGFGFDGGDIIDWFVVFFVVAFVKKMCALLGSL